MVLWALAKLRYRATRDHSILGTAPRCLALAYVRSLEAPGPVAGGAYPKQIAVVLWAGSTLGSAPRRFTPC